MVRSTRRKQKNWLAGPPDQSPAGATAEERDRQPIGRLDVKLWLRLLSCSTIIQKRLRRRLADSYNTTLPRFDVMAALERSKVGMTMGQLSKHLLVSNGNVTTVVRALETDGLVKTVAAPHDRRSSIVQLTPRGFSEFAPMASELRGWIAEALAGVPQESQLGLYDLLGIVKHSIAASGPADED